MILLFYQVSVYFFVALIVLISFFRAMHYFDCDTMTKFIPKALRSVSLSVSFMAAVLMMTGLFGSFAPEGAIISSAKAQETKLVVQGSGLPVPRFVSLKSDEVNMRVGPGREYPLSWVYKQKHLPVKVIAEFDIWRKVIDHEGTTGWVHGQLVTLKRYALIQSRLTKLYRKADFDSPVVAVADKGVLVELQLCEPQWCRVATDELRAFVRREDIWGVLDTETLN